MGDELRSWLFDQERRFSRLIAKKPGIRLDEDFVVEAASADLVRNRLVLTARKRTGGALCFALVPDGTPGPFLARSNRFQLSLDDSEGRSLTPDEESAMGALVAMLELEVVAKSPGEPRSAEAASVWLDRILKAYARHAPLRSARIAEGAGQIILTLELEDAVVTLTVRPLDSEPAWAKTRSLSLGITSNAESELLPETERQLGVLRTLMDSSDPGPLTFPVGAEVLQKSSNHSLRFPGRDWGMPLHVRWRANAVAFLKRTALARWFSGRSPGGS